jgi:RNA polymerase sigma-70 factor (sigma-E family)
VAEADPWADRAATRDGAVDALFRAQYATLLRLAYCLVADRSQAEDAVQEAFASLYAHWDRLRDPAAASGYVRSAVVKRCRSSVRTRVRERGRWVLIEDVPASEDQAVARDQGSRLVQAVQGLPRRQREVIVCRYFLELNVAETATVLGIGEGSVKRHAHRALATLSGWAEVESR